MKKAHIYAIPAIGAALIAVLAIYSAKLCNRAHCYCF